MERASPCVCSESWPQMPFFFLNHIWVLSSSGCTGSWLRMSRDGGLEGGGRQGTKKEKSAFPYSNKLLQETADSSSTEEMKRLETRAWQAPCPQQAGRLPFNQPLVVPVLSLFLISEQCSYTAQAESSAASSTGLALSSREKGLFWQ